MYLSLEATDEALLRLKDILPEDFHKVSSEPSSYYANTNEVLVKAEVKVGNLQILFKKWFPATDELVAQMGEKHQKEYQEHKDKK